MARCRIFWPLQLTRAYLDESSIARAVEKDLTFHLIPCLLGVREYVVEFVERGWEWWGTFTHDELKFDHMSQQMAPSASRA